MELDRVLSSIAAVVLGLVLSPVIAVLGFIVWYEAGGKNSGGIFASVVGIAAFILIVWKSGGILRRILERARSTFPEPIQSCIEFSVVGAFLFGGVMLAGILLLGHTRPIGWEFDRVLPSMALGFAVFFVAGLPVGLLRRRKGDP